jgi:ADP-L-glycero-D-manno-heptose 6-epimerase
MIIVTGGAGFIGSAMVWKLNQQGIDDIVIVDHMGDGQKWRNLNKLRFTTVLHKNDLFQWLDDQGPRANIDGVIHMGACSTTTERDVDYLVANNLNYSIWLWNYCVEYQVPFIYASSAATYGGGELGFHDGYEKTDQLQPLNPYGFSKQKFDQWVLKQTKKPPFWAGLKFFNVYGPQEYHKGGQSSVIFQWLPQVKETGAIRLFKSYRDDYRHGEQKRDFVYVKDCTEIMWHFLQNGPKHTPGIYNVGSGEARTFADLARAVMKAAGKPDGRLEFIDMPPTLINQYQYFTQADLTRLREKGGYRKPMTSIEHGVAEYVGNYLMKDDPYL